MRTQEVAVHKEMTSTRQIKTEELLSCLPNPARALDVFGLLTGLRSKTAKTTSDLVLSVISFLEQVYHGPVTTRSFPG